MKNLKIEMIVNNKDELLKYLLKNVDNKSKNNIKSLLKNGNVYVNNNKITKHNYIVNPKDFIKIELASINNSIKILYEDKYLIIVEKPAGLLTVSTEKEKDNTLYHKVSEYLKNKENCKIFIVNRIDKETSGIVVFAKDMKTKKTFQDNWDNLVKNKEYIALVNGITNESGTIKSYLNENKEHMVYSSNVGKLAITKYKRIKNNDKYSLLSVNIITGRKNQIRVHMKDINHTVVGDTKYGFKDKKINRLMLHSYKLEFIHPVNKKDVIVTSEIPPLFNNIFNV